MGQSVRAITIVLLSLGLMMFPIAWLEEKPHAITWTLRFAAPAVVILCGVLLTWQSRRPDLAPDLLRRQFSGYLERDGFCFVIQPATIEGVCYFETWYQNRYERRSEALIALRRGVTLVKTIAVQCEAAAYGRVLVPYAVHGNYQGTERVFEIYADVRYPDGRGRLLRFRHGGGVGRVKVVDWSNFHANRTISFAPGLLIHHRPARVKMLLPAGVAQTVTDETPAYAETIWRLGDADDVVPAVTVAG